MFRCRETKMVRALLVDAGFFVYVGGGFQAVARSAKRLQIELSMRPAVNQRDDMVKLRFDNRVERTAAILASLTAAMINAVFDVRRNFCVVRLADPLWR